MKEKVKKFMEEKKIKGKEGMIILLLAGVLLAVIAIPAEKDDKENKKEETTEIPERMEYDDYASRLEGRLEEILSCMEGVGEVKVMITLQASSREVVEKDVSTGSEAEPIDGSVVTTHTDKEENTVYTDDGSTPYVIQEIYPEIEGVFVVAEGGGNSYVNIAIVDAIQALFDVDVHKIKIVKMNTN